MESNIENTTEAVTSTQQEAQGIFYYFSSPAFYSSLVVIALTAVTVILIGKLFKTLIKRYKDKAGDAYSGSKETLLHMFGSIFKGVAVVFGIIVVLSVNGVQVTALITSVSIVSAIIGLALQDLMKDLIQGISIIADKFFKVGDVIRYNGINGEVTQVTIRCTKITDIDTKDKLTISNRFLSQVSVASHQRDLDIRLSYHEDVKKVYEVMKEICQDAIELDQLESITFKGIQEFENSGIVYRLRFFAYPKYLPEVSRSINKITFEKFIENGIQISYDQLVVIEQEDLNVSESPVQLKKTAK